MKSSHFKALGGLAVVLLLLVGCANPLQSSLDSVSVAGSKSVLVVMPAPSLIPGNYVSLGTGPQNKKDGTTVLVPGASSNPNSPVQEIASDGYPVLGQSYGPLTVTKLLYKASGEVYGFEFTSEIPVLAVYLKGGSEGGNFYNCAPDGATKGTVVTPLTGKNGNGGNAAISHWIVAWTPRVLVSATVASATFDRDWNWTIAKANDAPSNSSASPIEMQAASTLSVNYTVSGVSTPVEKNFLINGTVTVTNPAYNKTPALLSGINAVPPNGSATVAGTFPASIAAGSGATFSFSGALASKTNGAVVVTTVVAPTSVAKDNSSSASYAFGADPANVYDASIAIEDSLVPSAGRTITASNDPYSFSYVYSVSAPAAGQTKQVHNVASYVTSDTDETNDAGSASSDLWVKVPAPVVPHTTTTTLPPTQTTTYTTPDTGWAKLEGKSIAINSLDTRENKWGWTNGPLGNGTYSFQIYVGAGQNDISKGTLVGTLTVNYFGGSAAVTYTMYQGYVLAQTHLYVGSVPLPASGGAPGQFANNSGALNYVTSYSKTVNGLSGDIYVAAHAEVSKVITQ
jgi:hypothetical protein